VGDQIYEYELAQNVLNLAFIQLIDNPFGLIQLFNDDLAPQNSLSSTYLSNFYPSLLTSHSVLGRRFINHLCILQQELILKPIIQMAYSRGIGKYIPWIGMGGTERASKTLVKGPDFIET
jgi:hypothetical protein